MPGDKQPKAAASGKNTQAAMLVEMALANGVELFHDQHGEPYAALPLSHREIWPVASRNVRRWVSGLLWKETREAASRETLAASINVLSSIAVFEGAEHPLEVRVAWHDGALWYDLGDWRAVKIVADSWQVVERPPILFRHLSHQRPQVEPLHGGTFDDIFRFLFPLRADDDRILLGTTCLAYFLPGTPRPILSHAGSQGSGKSTKARMIKRLVDPSFAPSIRRLADFRELQLQLEQHWLLNIDNVSAIRYEISDALAAAVTGDSDMRRQLYTDQDMVLLSYMRPVMMNGLTHAVQRPDLLDRAVLITHERIPEAQRQEEAALWAHFEAALPGILGGAFDILSKAIAIYPTVSLVSKPRMADFARWGYAIAEAAGWGGPRFLAAYERNTTQQHEEAVAASVVAQAVFAFMEGRQEWQGPASKLKPELDAVATLQGVDVGDRRSGWPQDAPRLSKELHRLAETLSALGIEVTFPAQGKLRSVRLRGVTETTVGTVGTVGARSSHADGRSRAADGNQPSTSSDADAADGTDGKNAHSSGSQPWKADL